MGRYLQTKVPSPSPAASAAPIAEEPNPSADTQFAALRESFETELPSRIVEIGSAIVAGDLPRVADLAHQLKGTSGCFGLSAVCDAAAALQSAADLSEPPERIEKCFQTLTEKTPHPTPAKAA